MEGTTVRIGSVTLASHILLAIFENLRSQNNKRQLFIKAGYDDLQTIFYELLITRGKYLDGVLYSKLEYLKDLFVFSNSSLTLFSYTLQAALEHLQLGGTICWPNSEEPDLMRLNPSATKYYEDVLLRNTDQRLAYQDVISAQEIAKIMSQHLPWRQLIVDRHYLMNTTD